MDKITLADSGYVEFELRTTDGETVCRPIDLFAVSHDLLALDRQARGDAAEPEPGAFERLVQGYVAEKLGYPPVSRFAAGRFARAVFQAVDTLRG